VKPNSMRIFLSTLPAPTFAAAQGALVQEPRRRHAAALQNNRAQAHAAPTEQREPLVRSASALCGQRVLSRDEHTLGTVSELMLDLADNRIAYAVVASGGFMGVGERFYAVPWNAMSLDAQRNSFVLDISKLDFAQAPSFDRDHWPHMDQLHWHQQVHRFYDSRPAWD
jgi:sporulation protein YlmC with PRC-barrel domain